MTELKLDPKVAAKVGEGLAPYINEMWRKQDGHWVGIVEFKHARREEPGVGEDKAAAVKIRLTHCEIAPPDHAEQLRELLQALYKLRTAMGTLDDSEVFDRQVIPDRLKWAVDTMLWPPQPGDVWLAGEEPWFGIVGDDGDTWLINSSGERHRYTSVMAEYEQLDLKARRPVKRGDDSA